jgi:putative ATP-binding cassette transporter
MRTFRGLMSAYWLSPRWKEAWGLTLAIIILTALSSKASVWMAEASGALVNSIAFFHDAGNPTPLATLFTSAGALVLLVILKDAGIIGVRHWFSSTLHRKWRGWLDSRFNEALLDVNICTSSTARPKRGAPKGRLRTMSTSACRNPSST